MRLRILTTVTLIAALVGFGLVGPAAAGDVYCPSSVALMKNSDIPPWLSTAPKRTTSCRIGAKATAPYLCIAASGRDVYGRKPVEDAGAVIKLSGKETTGTELTALNRIYGYPASATAARAWSALVQKSKACPALVNTSRVSPGESLQIRQTNSVAGLPVVLGHRGIALTQTLRIVATGTFPFTLRATTYTAYRYVGRFIVKVELNSSTRVSTPVGLNAQQKGWTRNEVIRVAQRLLRVP